MEFEVNSVYLYGKVPIRQGHKQVGLQVGAVNLWSWEKKRKKEKKN